MLMIPADTAKLAIRLAEKTGRSPQDVIRLAVETSARDAGLPIDDLEDADLQSIVAAAQAIVARSVGRPILDPRSDDEIIGYDKNGIPE